MTGDEYMNRSTEVFQSLMDQWLDLVPGHDPAGEAGPFMVTGDDKWATWLGVDDVADWDGRKVTVGVNPARPGHHGASSWDSSWLMTVSLDGRSTFEYFLDYSWTDADGPEAGRLLLIAIADGLEDLSSGAAAVRGNR
jgi:hypothetical protein